MPTTAAEPDRDLIVAPNRALGLQYANVNAIQDPVIVTRDYHLRGLDFDGFRVHLLRPFNPGMLDELERRSGMAGGTLESFCADSPNAADVVNAKISEGIRAAGEIVAEAIDAPADTSNAVDRVLASMYPDVAAAYQHTVNGSGS